MTLWLPASALLVTAVAGGLVAVAYRHALRDQWTFAALAIGAAALVIRVYAAGDFALHPWDERYHALVAKNLIRTPLVPVLYADPALPYDYRDWTGNHVWLHKPPLALWLQAASMRLFGVAEIPMRLPSVLLSTASVLMTYGIGRALFSPAVGLVAAVFHAFNGFLVDLAAGRRASDHVDTLLITIFEAGILAGLIAVKRRPSLAGVALGLACGLGYLAKSFPALLLLPMWAAVRQPYLPPRALIRDVAAAMAVGVVVAAPWAIYCATVFPREWAHESVYAWHHVTSVVENQGGPPWQYLADMPRYFGELIYVPLIAATASVVMGTSGPARRAMLAWIAVPYVAFSLMATKMPAYVAVAAPAMFLLQSEFWLWLNARRVSERGMRRSLLTAAVVIFALLPARHLLSPTGPLEARDRNPQWSRDLRRLTESIGASRAVVFNVPLPIEAMFYTPYVAYGGLPTGAQVRLLHDDGYRVFVYEAGTSERPVAVREVLSSSDGAR